jgi:hypothetical protein
MRDVREGRMGPKDPRYMQSLAFGINNAGYIKSAVDGAGYRDQPMERHACYVERRVAKAVTLRLMPNMRQMFEGMEREGLPHVSHFPYYDMLELK